MKNLLFKLLLGLLVLTGCNREDEPAIPVLDRDKGFGAPVTENSENHEITYQFKDGVFVWNENSTQFIEKVVADTILYIKENAPKEMIPSVDDIISSRVNEQLPYGLGNKVLSVTKVDDTYKCVTTLAPLDELFEELVVHATIPLTGSIVDGVYDTDGYFHPVSNSGRADIKLNPITFKLDGKLEEGSGVYKEMNATGEIKIGFSAVVDINLKEHTHEFSLTAEGGFFGGIEVLFEVLKKEKKEIINVPKLFQSVVTIGPLVLRPFVNFSAGVEAGVKGNVKTGISKPFGMKVGIKDGVFFKENLLSEKQDNIMTKFEWNAEGYAGVYSKLGFSIGLYTTNLAVGLDPTLKALVNASFNMEMEDLVQVKPELGFNVLLDFDGHFTLNMGKLYNYRKQETFISWPLYEISWPLLPSLVPNSVTIQEYKNTDHLTFIAGYDYTGGLLSLFTDIKPIFRVYDDLGDAYCFTTDKKLTTDKEPQHFEFEVTGLQYDKDYIGKPGVELFGLKFDNKGINFKAVSPEKGEDNNGGEESSGSEGSGNNEGKGEEGGGTPQDGCESCAAGHCHAHNVFSKSVSTGQKNQNAGKKN